MKAILLAAGFGSRLRPVTLRTPKCLVTVGGRPLLEIWLDQLIQAGVQEILINTHYLHQQVADFVRASPYAGRITLVYEPVLLGTAGTVSRALDFWGDDDVLIAHADNLCLCDFAKFFNTYANRKTELLGAMMVFRADNPKSCGVVAVDDQNVLQDFFEKVAEPPTNLANAAIYVFSPETKQIFQSLTQAEHDISLHVIPKLLGRVVVWENKDYMRDIGTVQSLRQANLDFEDGVLV